MASDPVPPPITVVEMDVEKQVPAPAPEKVSEKVSEKDDKKKSAGVVVTVMHLGDDAALDSDGVTADGVHQVDEKEEDLETYPEGGLRAWLVVLGAWCGMFGSMGMLNSISVFNAYVSENQLADYPASTTGWIWSVFMFLSLFPGIIVGPVFDANGPKWLLWPGSIAIVLGILLSSFATQYWHFMLTISIVTGIASSMIFGPCMAAVGHWFKERRGLAMGIVGTGAVSAGIVLPLLLQALLPIIGWGWTMRVMALVEMVCLLTSCLLVRTRLPPAPSASMLPDLNMFRDKAFLINTITEFFLELGIYAPTNYLSTFALAAGFPLSFSFTVISILNAANAFGRIAPGLISPKVGTFNQLIATCLFAAVTVMAILFPVGYMKGGLIGFALAYGFCMGSVMTLSPLCIGKLCETRKFGSYYSGMYLIVAWGYLFGTPLGGVIIDASGFKTIFIFAAALWVLSAIGFSIVRAVKVGWKPSVY
jgi:MFS family permease